MRSQRPAARSPPALSAASSHSLTASSIPRLDEAPPRVPGGSSEPRARGFSQGPECSPGQREPRLQEVPARHPQAAPRPLTAPTTQARIPAAFPQHTRTRPPCLPPSLSSSSRLSASLEGPGEPAECRPLGPGAAAGGGAVRKPPRQRAAPNGHGLEG